MTDQNPFDGEDLNIPGRVVEILQTAQGVAAGAFAMAALQLEASGIRQAAEGLVAKLGINKCPQF